MGGCRAAAGRRSETRPAARADHLAEGACSETTTLEACAVLSVLLGSGSSRQLSCVCLQNKLVVTVTPSGKIVDSCGNVLSLGSPAMAMHVTC